MSSREIIDSLIRNKKAERMGLFDQPWSDTLEAWKTQGYPFDPKTGVPQNPAEHFGFDMEEVGGWFDVLPIQGYSKVIEETDEWQLRENGAGAQLKYWKHKSGTPEHVNFKMTTRDIWEKEYKPLLHASESRMDAETAKQRLKSARDRGVWASYGNLGFWEIMRESLGDLCMFETLLLDPDWVLDFNQVYLEFFKQQYCMFFEKAGLPDGIWLYDDLAYKNGTFCSPEVLYELYFPFYKQMADFFHSYDLPVVFHCCGNAEGAIPMIVDAGYDALNPMERKAGCDPLKFARLYKDKLAFIGGLNAMTLESGDREQIQSEAKELIDGMREIGAAYIFGSDHSLSPNVRYEDFQFAVEYYRNNAFY